MTELYYNRFDTEKQRGICKECDAYRHSGFENPLWRNCPDNCFIKIQNLRLFDNHLKKSNDNKKMNFITIQDFKRRITDLDKLQLFCNRIGYLFEEGYYCIESGKVPLPNSNLHIHILGKYKNSKKAKGKICLEWSKLFDTNLCENDFWKLKQWRNSPDMPPYEQWVQEKKDYFINEMKGNHENVIDLGARGAWGVSTSLL